MNSRDRDSCGGYSPDTPKVLDCVGIVGSSGAVGAEMIKCLGDRDFQTAKLRLFAHRAAGSVVKTYLGNVTVEPFSVEAAQSCEIVLMAVSGSFALEYAPKIAGGPKGTVVIDNSSAFRYNPEIPLVVPEINGWKSQGAAIIANPNCTTAIGAMALWPIHQKYKLTKVLMATYQASSGAGAEGMKELVDGVAAFCADGKVPAPTVFSHPLPFNVIPHIDAFQPNGYTKEEMKVAWELRKICGLSEAVRISCTAVRVPTLRAHSEAVVIETEDEITPDDCRSILGNAPGVDLVDDPEQQRYPMPVTASGKDNVEVGRIRQSLVFGSRGLEMFICGDQLLRGAALNAVLIAERVARPPKVRSPPLRETAPGSLLGPPWEIHKFGGASLATADLYRQCGDQLVSEAAGSAGAGAVPIAAVVSAMKDMTDRLIATVDAAVRPVAGGLAVAAALLDTAVGVQLACVKDLLAGNDEAIAAVVGAINADCNDVRALLKSASLLRTASTTTVEYIAGMGELWSARTLVAYLTAKGAPALMMDTRETVIVKKKEIGLGEKGAAVDMEMEPLFDLMARRLDDWWELQTEAIEAAGGVLPLLVITGFIASTPDGVPTTLKRSGSDYTATIMASLLQAKQVTLWKNVDGIFTADPRAVPKAYSLTSISYSEAIELAYFGGEVLHPSAMRPCMENNITILVRNILNPSFSGTRITNQDEPLLRRSANGGSEVGSEVGVESAVKMVTTIESIATINIKAGSWGSVAAVAERAMTAMLAADVKIVLVTQASSSHSLTVAVDEAASDRGLRALEAAFELELIRGDIVGLSLQKRLAALTVVGPMVGIVGTLAKLINGLSTSGINVYAVAQGSSERSISALVSRDALGDAMKAVHHAYLE